MSEPEEIKHVILTLSVNADAHVVAAMLEQAKGLEGSMEWFLSQIKAEVGDDNFDRSMTMNMLCLCLYQMGEREAETEDRVRPEPIRVPGNETTKLLDEQVAMYDLSGEKFPDDY